MSAPLLLNAFLAGAVAAAPADSTRLQALVREALDRNPSVRAAHLEAEAFRLEASHHRYLGPPKVGVEYFEAPASSFPDPLKEQQEIDYFLEQDLPFPGKLGLDAKAARLRGQAGDSRARLAERDLARDVKTVYYEIGYIDARRALNGQNQALVRRLVESARKQYEVGLGRQSDILRSQAELTALLDDSLGLEQERASAVGRLNALLDRPQDADFGPVEADAGDGGELPSWESLAAGLERHPAVGALQAETGMREAELASARRGFWPDFTVRGEFKDMLRSPVGSHGSTPGNYWSLMLGMDLPVAPWSLPKYLAGYRGARTALERSRQESRGMRNRVGAEIRDAWARARAAQGRLRLVREAMVPQADQALQSTLSAYQTGKAELMALLDAYRMALSARQEEAMDGMKWRVALADLESLGGGK